MTGFSLIALIVGVVVASILFFLLLAVVTPKLVYKYLQGPLEERIAAHYQPDQILMQDLRANSFGRESARPVPLRGNGGLVLTRNQLHFFMFVPKSDLCIPLDAISELSFTKRHRGKVTIYDLLKVRFTVDGQQDSIAWYLSEPQAWKSKIEALKAGGATR